MDAQSVTKDLKAKFGKVVQAIWVEGEMTFLAIYSVEDQEGAETVLLTLRPSFDKDFLVTVNSIENQGTDRWTVHAAQGTWIIQTPPVPEVADEWASQMRRGGFNA